MSVGRYRFWVKSKGVKGDPVQTSARPSRTHATLPGPPPSKPPTPVVQSWGRYYDWAARVLFTMAWIWYLCLRAPKLFPFAQWSSCRIIVLIKGVAWIVGTRQRVHLRHAKPVDSYCGWLSVPDSKHPPMSAGVKSLSFGSLSLPLSNSCRVSAI